MQFRVDASTVQAIEDTDMYVGTGLYGRRDADTRRTYIPSVSEGLSLSAPHENLVKLENEIKLDPPLETRPPARRAGAHDRAYGDATQHAPARDRFGTDTVCIWIERIRLNSQ